jgi:hypothetical protein
MSLQTPVLFCLFNRPDLARRVFASIAAMQPRHLLISCDGPRSGYPSDQNLVARSRAIVDAVDWPCDVETFFPDTNQGCRRQMSAAITWAFEQHEKIIILEDDCLPDPTFFSYCQQLLDRYASNRQVMMISGDNFQERLRSRSGPDYYFSGYTHIWGWASWRRAWKQFDLSMASWSHGTGRPVLENYCCHEAEQMYWASIFDRQKRGEIDTWDYSWQWSVWQQRGLVVLPERNLVTNIGFRADGTHTTDDGHWLAEKPAESMPSLVHPQVIQRNRQADARTWSRVFAPPPLERRVSRPRPLFFRRLFGSRVA